MRSSGATRIETGLLRAKANAWNSQRHDLALLLRRQSALEPGKACAALQAAIGLFEIEIGQHCRKQFDGFVRVDDLAWLGIKRSGLDIGCQDFAIAVENIGTRCKYRAGRAIIARGVFLHPVIDQAVRR